MSVVIERTRLGRIPALIVRPAARSVALPTVLWLHGFGADKEVHLPELCRFGEAGLLAVGIDAVGHGQRRFVDLPSQFSRSSPASVEVFHSCVRQTVAELPELIDLLVGRGSSDPARIAVAGVSMGACMVYAAIAGERRFPVEVAMLGSPEPPPADADRQPAERCFPTALLSITAGQDNVVPPDAALALHQRLEPRYRARPERLRYREIPRASHFLRPEEWDGAVAEASAWLVSFLS